MEYKILTANKEKMSYWENANIGDLIQLSDEQTISFLMDNGCENLDHGADFEIKRKRVITAQDGPARWLLLDISLKDFLWYVVVKSTGAEVDVKVCYIPDNFTEGNRQDLLDNDLHWIFGEPEDEENFDVAKLAFSPTIEEEEGVIFSTEGSEYGECSEGSERSFTTITEYLSTSEMDNPEMILLEFNNIEEWSNEEESDEDDFGDVEVEETGGVDIDTESSFIILLQGCMVHLNDIKLLK